MKEAAMICWSAENVMAFFSGSCLLDGEVLRPLSHVRSNWELMPDIGGLYEIEEDSFAGMLNSLVSEIAATTPPSDYHSYENSVAAYMNLVRDETYTLRKGRWRYAADGRTLSVHELTYMLEQASCDSNDIPDLVLAAAGRVRAALKFEQHHYDEMEGGHRIMLAALLTIILFRRSDNQGGLC